MPNSIRSERQYSRLEMLPSPSHNIIMVPCDDNNNNNNNNENEYDDEQIETELELDENTIESIINHKFLNDESDDNNHKYLYLIQWENFDTPTWETPQNIHQNAINNYWKLKGYQIDKHGIITNITDLSNELRLEFIVWCYIRQEFEDGSNVINFPIGLKYLIKHFCRKKIISSNILTFKEDIDFCQLLSTKLPNFINTKFKLLYRASEHLFSADKFHDLCDNYEEKIVIIKNNYGNVFGGYESDSSFLFLIRSYIASETCPKLFERNCTYNTYNWKIQNTIDTVRGPVFGHDIVINDNCNSNHNSYCRQQQYLCDSKQLCGSNDVDSLPIQLCGSNDFVSKHYFQVLEYEVLGMY